MTDPSSEDARWLRHSFDLARKSREQGDQPFAAVLVGPDGALLLEVLNSRNRDRDIAAHAEMNLVRQAVKVVPFAELPGATLYASTEPCMMCAGVIAWSGIGTVVFGLSQVRLNQIPVGRPPRFSRPTRLADLLDGIVPPVSVRGPLLEDEALGPHEGYWS
jgi:tRNA(Arg) A34 adenosine deaminase TadA